MNDMLVRDFVKMHYQFSAKVMDFFHAFLQRNEMSEGPFLVFETHKFEP